MQNAENIPIIDCHQHLWDFSIIRPPWLTGAGLPLEQSHTPDDYRQASANCGIIQSVYVEVGAAPADRLTEAAYAAARCADPDDPLCALVAGGDFNDSDFAAYLDKLVATAGPYLRGVRSSLPRFNHEETGWLRNAALLGERGLHAELLARPGELRLVARFAKDCPGTRFLLNHCARISPWADQSNLDFWLEGLLRVEEYANVVLKLSGLVNQAPTGAVPDGADRVQTFAAVAAPVVATILDTFHPRRVVWGSDWPVCNTTSSLAEWVAVTRQVLGTYPHADQEAILNGNARIWYRLPPRTA